MAVFRSVFCLLQIQCKFFITPNPLAEVHVIAFIDYTIFIVHLFKLLKYKFFLQTALANSNMCVLLSFESSHRFPFSSKLLFSIQLLSSS